jgi:hypothetical protein
MYADRKTRGERRVMSRVVSFFCRHHGFLPQKNLLGSFPLRQQKRQYEFGLGGRIRRIGPLQKSACWLLTESAGLPE